MGRIKTQLVKRATKKILHDMNNEGSKDFNENKKIIAQHAEFRSKKLRNVVAGYLTRLIRRRKEE